MRAEADHLVVVGGPDRHGDQGGARHPGRVAGLEVLYEKPDFRRYQSGQPIVLNFSGAYIITVMRHVYTWRILQFCDFFGPTGT